MRLFAPEGPERSCPIPKKAAKRLFQAEPEEPGQPGFHPTFQIPVFQMFKDCCFACSLFPQSKTFRKSRDIFIVFLDWMVWHTVRPWGKPKGRKPKKPAVFQREPEEGHCPHRSNHLDKRLGMILSHEPEEQSDSDTSTGSEPPGPSVFCLGWHELTRTCKANLTRDASQAGRQVQQKRPYDNKQRAEKAAYVRKGGQFKKNGVSEKRILQILSKDICLCNPVQN